MTAKFETVVVAPYFEDIAGEQFIADLAQHIGKKDYLLIVDDGSVDIPLNPDLLKQHKLRGTVIKLWRNVGHQTAIACGLADAVTQLSFDRLVIMDSDGEDRPAAIKQLLENLEQDQQCDIVVAARKSMTPSAAIRLAGLNETGMHVAASAMNSRLRLRELMIDRGARYAGSSKMNLVSLTLHGLRSVMVFAETVLVRITLFCAAAAAIILSAMLAMVVLKLTGLAIPGWFSTVSGILLLLLFQVGLVTLLVLLSAGNLRSSAATELSKFNCVTT